MTDLQLIDGIQANLNNMMQKFGHTVARGDFRAAAVIATRLREKAQAAAGFFGDNPDAADLLEDFDPAKIQRCVITMKRLQNEAGK